MWRIIFKSYFLYISLFIIGFRSFWYADQQSQYQFLLVSQAIQKSSIVLPFGLDFGTNTMLIPWYYLKYLKVAWNSKINHSFSIDFFLDEPTLFSKANVDILNMFFSSL